MSTSILVLVPEMVVGAILLTVTRPLFHHLWTTPVTSGHSTEHWVNISGIYVFFNRSRFNEQTIFYTASQSPLGLASGSPPPPPLMGSASNLQLGLMGSANNANRGLMNPAPGAETMSKFRASGMCGSENVLVYSYYHITIYCIHQVLLL